MTSKPKPNKHADNCPCGDCHKERGMLITAGDDFIRNPGCAGTCYCHSLPVQYGELQHGCCSNCGCPKNMDGFLYWKNGKKEPEKKTEGRRIEP